MSNDESEPEPEPIDEARHRELVQKHVYGDPKRRPSGSKAKWFKATSSASVGIEIAVAICGCTLLARWLETQYTHWSPWTTVIGFTIGIGAAVQALIRTSKQYQKEIAQLRAEGKLGEAIPYDDDDGETMRDP